MNFAVFFCFSSDHIRCHPETTVALKTLSTRLCLQHLIVTIADGKTDNFTDYRYQPSHNYFLIAWTIVTQSWHRRRRRSLMSCSEYWIPMHVWSPAPWSVSTTSRRTALAGHPSASAVLACHDCPPVSPESSTDVPYQLLRSSVRCCRSPAPAIRQPWKPTCLPVVSISLTVR